MKAVAFLLPTALAACATEGVPPGSGWSRAPDLSAYSAMTTFGAVAREQSVLCYGRSPARVERNWTEDFGSREAAVIAALVGRHGPQAVERAEAAAEVTRNVACPDVQNWRWREQYSRLLRLLETRLGLA